jgi:GNAT superfamily N-acetyltransferase
VNDQAAAHLSGLLGAIGRLPGSHHGDDGSVVWAAAAIPWPLFNGALVHGPEPDGDAVDRALAGLYESGAPWFWYEMADTPAWVPERLRAAGAAPAAERSIWLQVDPHELPTPEIPDEIEVEEALGEAAWHRWAAELREVNRFPREAERSWVEAARRTGWCGPPWRAWSARRNDCIAAVTLMIETGSVAALYGFGTHPDFRGIGLGRQMMLLPLAETNAVVGGFWPEGGMRPLYASLGFAERGWTRRWLGGVPSPRLARRATEPTLGDPSSAKRPGTH